jgi:CxxC motif-containing protein (DUF1111 family)
LNPAEAAFFDLAKSVFLETDGVPEGLGPRFNLDSCVPQGEASGSQFRTAPLWGLGQRLFFLHDGRTSDLLQAIQAHLSPQSEANVSVGLFNSLAPVDKQDLLNFLRSL